MSIWDPSGPRAHRWRPRRIEAPEESALSRSRRWQLLPLAALAVLLPPIPAPGDDPTAATEVVVLPPPPAAPWQPLTFRRIERETRYEAVSVDGHPAVRADSDCSASALFLPLPDADLERTPHLAWRWRVERPLDVADEQARGGDDFAARVYAVFAFEREHASLSERVGRRLVETFYRQELPGHALNFVWTGRTPAGASWDNPHHTSSKMVALENGAANGWREASVDLRARHRALFARPAPALEGIALMSDSDDSCTKATAWFADFRLASAPPALTDGETRGPSGASKVR